MEGGAGFIYWFVDGCHGYVLYFVECYSDLLGLRIDFKGFCSMALCIHGHSSAFGPSKSIIIIKAR